MPYASTATVKIARKDVAHEDLNPLPFLQGEDHSHSIQRLNEIVHDTLGGYNALSEPKQLEAGATPRTHGSDLSGFRLFSWSTATQPIELTHPYQPNSTTPYVSYEDTDDEAKRRAERANQISIEGADILRGLQYSRSFKRNHTPESMKPVLPSNFKSSNLMVAKKESPVTNVVLETSVLFPRTKCCPVIPVQSFEDTSKKHTRKRKRIHQVRNLSHQKRVIRGKR